MSAGAARVDLFRMAVHLPALADRGHEPLPGGPLPCGAVSVEVQLNRSLLDIG